jgi:hypothetical protein
MKEEVSFDPMTGERIVKQTEEVSFDPMTGERIVKKEAEEVSFDPMTGERIVKRASTEEVSFDPMTGERIVKQAEEVSFDPMTGERIVKGGEQMSFDPMTGERISSTTKGFGKLKNRKWVSILAGVVVVVLVILCGITSGAFLGKSQKIMLAAIKTYKTHNNILGLDDALSVLSKKKYTISVNGEYEDNSFDVSFLNLGKEKGITGELKIDDDFRSEVDGLLTGSEVKLAVPDYTDKVFTYNYQEDKDGYIAEVLEDEFGEDAIKLIDNSLKYLYDNGAEDDLKKMTKDCVKQFNKMKFTKAEKESFEINGKDRTCKGYTTTLDQDSLEAYVDIIQDYYENRVERLKDSSGKSELTEDMEEDIDDFFDEVYDSLKYVDLECSFYLYKGKLVAIIMDAGDEQFQIQVNSTKNMLEKITAIYSVGKNDYEVTWEGDVSSKEESYVLRYEGTRLMKLEYDKSSGDVELDVMDADVEVDINIKKKGGVLTYALDLSEDGDELSAAVSFSGKASKPKFTGEEFDIGNASESDFEDLMEDLEDEFY